MSNVAESDASGKEPRSVPVTALFPRFIGNSTISSELRPVTRPGAEQLLLQMTAVAISGSERHQFTNGCGVTPGHEAAGVVVMAGSEANVPVGTSGVVYMMDYCGRCRSCRSGYTNQCLAKRGDIGFSRDGGYGPYVLVNSNIFFPVEPDITPAESTLLLDVMGTGGHAIHRALAARMDTESLIIGGAGPIGLGILAMAKLTLGQNVPVVVLDMNPYRLQLAQKLGGLPVNIREVQLAKAMKNYGVLPDAAIDTTGKATVRQALLEGLAKRGVLVCVGHGETLQVDVSRHLIGPERAVMGTEYFRFDEFPENVKLLRQNRKYLSQIITHRLPVGKLQEAFETFFKGQSGRIIVEHE